MKRSLDERKSRHQQLLSPLHMPGTGLKLPYAPTLGPCVPESSANAVVEAKGVLQTLRFRACWMTNGTISATTNAYKSNAQLDVSKQVVDVLVIATQRTIAVICFSTLADGLFFHISSSSMAIIFVLPHPIGATSRALLDAANCTISN